MLRDDEEKDIADYAQKDDYVYPAFILIYYGFVDLIPMAGQYVAVKIMPRPDKQKKYYISSHDGAFVHSTSEETIDLLPDYDDSIIRGQENSASTLYWTNRSCSPNGNSFR